MTKNMWGEGIHEISMCFPLIICGCALSSSQHLQMDRWYQAFVHFLFSKPICPKQMTTIHDGFQYALQVHFCIYLIHCITVQSITNIRYRFSVSFQNSKTRTQVLLRPEPTWSRTKDKTAVRFAFVLPTRSLHLPRYHFLFFCSTFLTYNHLFLTSPKKDKNSMSI